MNDEDFEPSDAALAARLAAVRPDDYARTRNHLEGAVTRLAPYLTHGFLGTVDVRDALAARGRPLHAGDKLLAELGWREYFRHLWRHHGAGILQSLHDGPRPDAHYARELPADLRAACTGVPAIDLAVRTLYRSGWLHNHARLWLASYTVHLRGVHWRSGADWMLGHLLDGDLASNHLSWQWVAGTASRKPYLFDAANVARWAPPAWHSPGSVIDRPYAELEAIARGAAPLPAAGAARDDGIDEPALTATPPRAAQAGGALAPPGALDLAGHDVILVHPWSLRAPAAPAPGACVVGLWIAELHARRPWSARRWAFVGRRMDTLAPLQGWGSAAAWRAALAGARSVRGYDDPHLQGMLDGLGNRLRLAAPPALFAEPGRACASFSQWWARVGGNGRGVNRT